MNKITKFDSRIKQGSKKAAELKAYLGFEYIKLKKDVNGLDFCISHLREYAKETKYIISIGRQVSDSAFVYNFFVENNKIKDFFQAFLDGKIEGEIIEIDKLKPEILA